jgi:hypothetical protein
MESVALAALVLLAVPHAAGGATTHAPVNQLSSPGVIAPADTGWLADSIRAGRRANRRAGYVVTEDQLDLEQDYPLSSVIIAHIPGIRVMRGSPFNRIVAGIHVSIKGNPCFVQMFMNGVFIADGDVDMVSVRDLALVEFRTPGNIPVQFQNNLQGAPCGVLLLWSKT